MKSQSKCKLIRGIVNSNELKHPNQHKATVQRNMPVEFVVQQSVMRGSDKTKANKSFSCHFTETSFLLPPPPKNPNKETSDYHIRSGCPRIGLWDGGKLLGFSLSFLCLSDSSGSTPLLDPRFSPSSPPTVRSNRQGRGVWADMLGAGSVLRLLVSNARTDDPLLPPPPPPLPEHTHTLISHS